jgi:hypothetical protein
MLFTFTKVTNNIRKKILWVLKKLIYIIPTGIVDFFFAKINFKIFFLKNIVYRIVKQLTKKTQLTKRIMKRLFYLLALMMLFCTKWQNGNVTTPEASS